MKISQGDTVEIDKKKYQVLKITSDIEFKDKQNPNSGDFIEFSVFLLHLENSKTITPTHRLHYYSKDKIALFSIRQLPGGAIELENRKELADKDIIIK